MDKRELFFFTETAIVDEAVKETSAPARGRGRGRGGAAGKSKEKLTAENWWIIKRQKKLEKKKKPT